MNAWVFLLLPTTLGVDVGWERQPDNSIQYILQIEPEAINGMMSGNELISTLPESVRNTIGKYSIRVGRDHLPNQGTWPPEVSNSSATRTPTAGTAGWNNATQPSYLPGATTPPTYPNSTGYPPANNGGFINSSLPGRTATTQYPPGSQTTAPNTGMSTSGFPIQTPNSTYPNNAAPTGTGYATPNAYGQQPYGQQNYGAPNYGAPQYGAPNNQYPNYQQPGYGPQYVAANPNGTSPNLPTDPNYYGPRLGDPQQYGMQTAKPSIEMPAPSGTVPYGQHYAGQAPPGYQPNNMPYAGAAYAQGDPRFTNTGEPKSADPAHTAVANKQATAVAAEPQSQWLSLTFALIGLFASLGANFYLGWTTFHLRERYRMMLSDRTTY